MIASHRSTLTLQTQDGRPCYECRRLVECFFVWLQWKRRFARSFGVLGYQLPRIMQLARITMLLLNHGMANGKIELDDFDRRFLS
jgi:hypothetical protein